ncbi:restriction endonuclease subunit S [Limosilactobacillus fermentum]
MRFDSLGNICTTVTDYVANGSFKALKENVSHKNAQDGYAILIRLADYRNKFKGPFEYIDRHGYNFLSKTKLYGNEIIISNVGAHLGTVFRTPTLGSPMSLGPNAILLKTKYIDDYYYYFFTSKKGQALLKTIVSGSAQPKFNKTDLKKLIVPVPSLDEQNKISRKLLAIDKKIQINEQINANLVELSNTIFKQILVSNDLHEFTINDIGTVAGGGTPSKKIISYWNGTIPWLSPKDLSNKPRIFTSSGENYITQQGLDNSSTKLLPRNTVLFSSRAPIGYLSIAKNRIATNQGFKSVIPNKQYPFWFIYELLKVETPRIINEANGSTFKEVSGSRLKQHIVYVPKSSDVLRYNSIFISLFQKMMQSESEIDTLNSLKRALLNKLF